MANRVLLGEHGTYGYGLFISKPAVDVTGANKNYFLFDTTGASMGQILVFQRHAVNNGSSVTETFNNFGKNTFGIVMYSPITSNYQMSIAQDQAYLSLDIEKDSGTQSTYTVANSKSGGGSVGATIIIFAENMTQ